MKAALVAIAVLVGLTASARTTPVGGTPRGRLLELAAKSKTIPVIVTVRVEGGWSAAATRVEHKDSKQRQKAKDTKNKILRDHPNARRVADRDYEFIPAFVLEVDQRTLQRLLEDENVLAIEENDAAVRTLEESTAIIGSDVAKSNGDDGSGQTIVVVDDGVASGHPFLGSRINQTAAACFSGNWSGTTLCPNSSTSMIGSGAGEPCPVAYNCTHGTQVAGIAAGQHPSDSGFFGVAPAATILPIQVYTATSGSASEAYRADVLEALDYILSIKNSYSIAAVNLSLRFPTNHASRGDCISYSTHPSGSNAALDAAVTALWENDIAVVAGMGNKVNSSEVDRIVAPACLTDAISVGATNDDDSIAIYSYVQGYMDFFAPGGKGYFPPTSGEGINTSSLTVSGGSYTNTYIESTGTSLAAPHVSGAFAVLRESAPSASVAALELALKNTGTPVTISPGVTIPRINVDLALVDLDVTAPTTPGSFSATGTASSVTLGWTASTDSDSGIDYYEIARRATRTAAFTVIDEVDVTDPTSYSDTSTSANKMYEYRIVAVDNYGNRSTAAADYAVTVTFTDDVMSASPTLIKGAHLAELRAAADGWREFALLSRVHGSYPAATGVVASSAWAGSSPAVLGALNDARSAMSLSAFSYHSGVSSPTTNGPIKKEHVQQLRDSMK